MSEQLNLVFGALADPSRRQVIGLLSSRGTVTATELSGELPMTRQAVAKHLATLADAGLVAGERQGRETRYRLTDAGAEWDDRLDALRAHLERRRDPVSRLTAVSTYDAVKDLPLEIESYELEPLEREVARGFTLRRTVVVLRGGGEEGRGEEVDYDPDAQQRFQARRGELPFAGRHTLDSFSVLQSGQTEYRRWAFESAALDLALRQAGRTLGEAVGREARPLRFVVSTRVANVEGWLALYPELHFKLDPDRDWRTRPSRSSSAAGVVDTVDFKGIYRAEFGSPPDPELYARIAAAFPEAWIEDPALTPETLAVLEPHRDRITWDAAIHEWSDVEALPFRPALPQLEAVAVRLGAAAVRLLRRVRARGHRLYGGGQFELGPGRDQIQLLASLFHPDAPNDVAPAGFNASEPVAGLPTPPLSLSPQPGFRA